MGKKRTEWVRELPEFSVEELEQVKALSREAGMKLGVQVRTARILLASLSILSEYDQKVTIRQLYYQFVARGYIDNSDKAYKNLDEILTTGRELGILPWDAFEDRARMMQGGDEVEFNVLERDPSGEAQNQVQRAYTPRMIYDIERWHGQKEYVEVWIEKDALAGMAARVTNERHVRLVTSRGFTSYTYKREAEERFKSEALAGKKGVLLYFGDLDGSGWRIHNVLDEFFPEGLVTLEKPALTFGQVQKFNPPPAFAKESDPNTPAFLKAHPELEGFTYELDALPPDELLNIIASSIDRYFDPEVYEEAQEERRAWYEKYKEELERLKELGNGRSS